MKPFRYFLMLLVAFCLIAGLAFVGACGDDDDDDDDDNDDDTGPFDDDDDTGDDDDDNDTGDDDTGDDDTGDDDDDTGDDDDDTTPPPTEPISILMKDFASGAVLTGVTCELVNNSTGNSFDPAVVTTSDGDGYCLFNQEEKAGVFAAKFSFAGYVTTYTFNASTEIDWVYPLASEGTRTAIYALLGQTYDPSKGIAAGTVQWYDGEFTEDVGCAQVTSSGGDTVYYVDGTSGLPSPSRTSTAPENGYYLSLNVAPGSYIYTANTDGDVTSATFPQLFADTIVYVNIVYSVPTFPENPTPDPCN